MAKRNFYYGLEDDDQVGGVDFDQLVKDEECPIGDAGEDSETTEVNISAAQASHNEAASAGGIVVGDNADDLEMDPVAASEAFIRKNFGLSVEDLEEVEDELVAAPDPEPVPEGTGDADVDTLTTVNVVAPAGATTETEEGPVDAMPEVDTPAAVAGVEFLYKIQSIEDDETTDSDVEFNVKTPNNEVDFDMAGKAITIEPAADAGSDDMDGDEAPAEEPAAEEPAEGGDEGATEEPAEGGEGGDEAPAEEGSEEDWYNFI